tara:strand:+ start:175 stop:384 length:210 start_codon:yes stop_codon:yes gene_type:complete
MAIAFIILSILNIFAELTEVCYDFGVTTRRYLIPALVTIYVAGEVSWDYLTSQEWTVTVYNQPLTRGFA